MVAIALIVAGAAVAFAPRSAADELDVPSLEAAVPAPQDLFSDRPAVGVEGSASLRMAEKRGYFRRAPPAIPFTDQVVEGLSAFHLPVYAVADPGVATGARFAGAGLKVGYREAPDNEALCATLMRCLMALDALARARWAEAQDEGRATQPLVVVVDAAAPAPQPADFPARAARAAVAVIPPAVQDAVWAPGPTPSWEILLAEVTAALPELEPGPLVIVLAGAEGAPSDAYDWLGEAEAAVLIDGADARVLRAEATPEAMSAAVTSGAFTVVLGADWSGEGDPARLGPREAAALGAHAVVVTPFSALQGGVGGWGPRR
jgi:hypothetical protein